MSALAGSFGGVRVLLTGHTGFKGGWLALWLRHLGAEVHGFALAPQHPSLHEGANVGSSLCGETIADLRDLPALEAALDAAQPALVFHLAAQPLVRLSYSDPLGTFATNVMGTANLLDAVRRAPTVRAVVVVTSDKCYENREWPWPYRETDHLGGADPYSASKGCAEIVAASWARSFFHSETAPLVATCRAGNVFGGGDWAEDRLVPDIVRAIAGGQPVVLRNPTAVRPWQHVLEPLHGYLRVAQRLLAGDRSVAGPWNFGPHAESSITVGELARRMVEFWGQGKIVESPPQANALHEARLLSLDSSKATALLRWKPLLSLSDALRLTIDWYRAHQQDPASLPALTAAQIAAYAEKCG